MKKINKVETLLFFLPVIVICIIFRKAIFFGGLYYDGDTILQFFPYLNFFARHGSLITYDILSGFPISVSITGIWFSPLSWLFVRLFDPFAAYPSIMVFNFFLTVAFTYAYSRKILLSVMASVMTSLTFTFSGQLMLWGNVLPNVNYFFILPAALYFLEYLIKNRAPYVFILLTGVILGLGWLSGHPQFVIYIHTFVALYYLYFIFREKVNERTKYALYLLLIFIISLTIGSAQLYPSFSFVSESARSGGVAAASYIGAGYLPQDLVHYVLPFWDPPMLHTAEPNLYLGIVPVILLFFALRQYRRIRVRYFPFYFWTFLFCFISAIYYSPLGAMLHLLPVFSVFRGAARIMFIGNFAAALMVGLLLDSFTVDAHDIIPAFKKHLRILRNAFILVVLPCIGIATVIYVYFRGNIERIAFGLFIRYRYAGTTQLPYEHYQSLIHEYVSGSLKDLSLFSLDIIVLIIFSIIGYVILKKFAANPSRSALVAICLITALNFVVVYGNHFAAVTRAQVLTEPATARFVREHTTETPSRVFSLFSGVAEFNELDVKCKDPEAADRLAFEKEILMPNSNMLYGIESIDGYENFMPRRMAQLLAYVGSDRAVAGTLLAQEKSPLEERIRKFLERKDMLRMMNVRYIISTFKLNDPDLTEVFRENVGRCDTEVRIYELSRVWPRAFFTGSYIVAAASDELNELRLKDLQNTVNKGIVVLDQGVARVSGSDDEAGVMKDVALIQGDDTVSITVDAPNDGIVYISYAWLPKWQASLDGRPVPLLKANEVYMAVFVPGGTHRIDLRYSLY